MSLRVQKSWQQIGSPEQPGNHKAPGLGQIVGITEEHLARAAELGGNPIVVLGHHESSGFVAKWEILEMRAE